MRQHFVARLTNATTRDITFIRCLKTDQYIKINNRLTLNDIMFSQNSAFSNLVAVNDLFCYVLYNKYDLNILNIGEF